MHPNAAMPQVRRPILRRAITRGDLDHPFQIADARAMPFTDNYSR